MQARKQRGRLPEVQAVRVVEALKRLGERAVAGRRFGDAISPNVDV